MASPAIVSLLAMAYVDRYRFTLEIVKPYICRSGLSASRIAKSQERSMGSVLGEDVVLRCKTHKQSKWHAKPGDQEQVQALSNC
jgi:hypothetical protein